MSGGKLLRAWREGAGLTQKTAAKRLGISQSSLCDYENSNSCPTIEQAARIQSGTDGNVPVIAWAPKPRKVRAAAPPIGTGTVL